MITDDDLIDRIRVLDPMAGATIALPALSDVLGDDVAARFAVPENLEPIALMPVYRPIAGRRRRVVASLTGLFAAAAVTGLTIALWPSPSTAPRPASPRPTSVDQAALATWAKFPVDHDPRPVVLTYSDVADPASGFASSDDKNDFMDKRVSLPASVALPITPKQTGGYTLRPARDAVAELIGPDDEAGPGGLVITGVALGAYRFATDRGDQTLPAWAVTVGGVADPAYVLAIAESQRFTPPTGTSLSEPAGYATVKGDHITVSYTPRHDSTGPCDPSYTQSVDFRPTGNFVELTITTTLTPPTSLGGSGLFSCPAIGAVTDQPMPGAPGTTALTLDSPLGNRPIVDNRGTPWSVTVTP